MSGCGDRMNETLKVGDTVLVFWGIEGELPGTVVDVWGDPPSQVRVELRFEDEPAPVVLLLPTSALKAA